MLKSKSWNLGKGKWRYVTISKSGLNKTYYNVSCWEANKRGSNRTLSSRRFTTRKQADRYFKTLVAKYKPKR